MPNYKDFTLKAKLDSFQSIETILKSMEAMCVGVDLQTDYYFNTEVGKLKYRKGTIENLITHYERKVIDGIEKTTVYRYDKNPSPEDINTLKSTHEQIGIVVKERKIFTIENIKIHLDRLPDNQLFIEVEAIDRDVKFTDDELKEQCYSLLAKLFISEDNLIKTGYLKE